MEDEYPSAQDRMRRAFIVLLSRLEDVIYGILGILLMGVALWTLISYFIGLGQLPASLRLASALDHFLLVLMLLELLHTILLFLRTHQFRHEPFLVVGIIAGIRRILVITAETSGGGASGHLLELGVTTAMVFLLAVALKVSTGAEKH